MSDKHKFSSTMRIDLTPDLDVQADRASASAAPSESAMTDVVVSGQCEIVGSADFRALLQSVYDAAIITTLEGNVVRGNRRAEQFFLYDVSEFPNLSITDLLSGSDDSLMQTICESLKNDQFILIQAYCSRSDKSVFPAEVSVNMLRISEQDYISFFIRDVTLRRQAEERLRAGHAAIQNSGNGIAVTDEKATLKYSNPAMCKLLGVEEGQMPPPQITSFLCDPHLGSAIRKTTAQGQAWSGELEMLCADGMTMFVQASVAPNVDADGDVVGMVWSLLDISDQKRIQHELIEHNNQLAEDLNLANEFQLAFIQREYPAFPPGIEAADSALEFGHVYIPSGAVGGDFFEIFAVSMSRVGIFISDVMGHGVRSALIVATIRGLIEELGAIRYDPAAFMTQMNKDLSRIINHPGQTLFVTALYLVVDLVSGDIVYSSAGHPRPMLISSGGATQLPNAENIIDPALGLFPSSEYHKQTHRVVAGDMMAFFTDGIVEAENAETICFDTSRLGDSLCRHSDQDVTTMLESLVHDVQLFSGRKHFADDVCLVGMKLRHLLDKRDA